MTIEEWADRFIAATQKHNVRQWGTFELLARGVGNDKMVAFPRQFGWGFTEREALIACLTQCKTENQFHAQLRDWLGLSAFNALLETTEEVAPVPEHLHNESNAE